MRALLLLTAAAALAGCQATSGIGGDPITGTWASADGVSVTTFSAGAFTTRERATGVDLASDGRYARVSDGFTMQWTSILANEDRSATCRFATRDQIACTTAQGAQFSLNRVA